MWIPIHRRPSFACRRKQKQMQWQQQPMSSVFLDKPVTDKLNVENVEINGMEAGHSCMQGLRVHMEDEHIIDKMDSLPDHTLLAIMDGKSPEFLAYLSDFGSPFVECFFCSMG
jgi:hypothetical protein